MGDRTHCWLTISGVLKSPADVDTLRRALRNAYCQSHDFLDDKKDLPTGTIDLEDDFHFEEVNYAEMDGDLCDMMRELGLDYVWSWNSGDDYGAGVEIQSWFPEFRGKESTVEGELFVLLSEVANPERLTELQAFNDRWHAILKQGLVYAPSAHSLLAHFANEAEALARWQAHRDLWSDKEEDAVV